MCKVVLYIAMSLDGYIADEQGGVNWLTGDGSDINNQGSYARFIERIDTVILGYKTYHQIVTELSPEEWPYVGKQSYVITHKKQNNQDEIIFTDENVYDLINKIKLDNGKDIWICGGASIINQVIDCVDQICISVIPSLLGKGIRLFDLQDKELLLKLISTENYNGIVDLWYERRL